MNLGKGGDASGRGRFAAASLAVLSLFISCSQKPPQELTIVWSSDILSADPNEKFETATDTYSMNVFEPLLRYDRQMSFVPVLATRWDIPDGKTWRFHLRSGVTFHDGTPFSADDVVFSLDRVRQQKKSDLAPYLSVISSVRKVDQQTVEIISDRPAGLLSVLSFVYMLPKKAVESRGAAFFEKPLGTGPYRFGEWKPGVHVKLDAFETYWGGAAPVKRVTFLHTEREKEWEVAKERAPAILLTPSRTTWNAHKNDGGFRAVTRPGMSVQYLALNLRGGKENPLADPRVRTALRAAVDVRSLIEKSAQGQAFPASQYVTPDIIGYDPTLAVPEFQPGVARRLLAEAGHPQGLDLKMVATEGPSTLADALVAQLAEAGVRVKKESVSDAGAFYDKLGRCDGDLFLTGWICSTGDASELFEGNFYGRGSHATSFTACGYSNPELDDMIDRIAKTLDPEIRRNLLQQAMRKVVSDLPWIPLWVTYDRYGMTLDVAWEPRPDNEIYLADVRLRK